MADALRVCDVLSPGDLRWSMQDTGNSKFVVHPATLLLWLLLVLHVCILGGALHFDARKKREGSWKEDYFLTRDRSHVSLLDASVYATVWGTFTALVREARGGTLSQMLLLWSANYFIRQSAASTLDIAEADVRFILNHMHQVTMAAAESSWTRQRNKEFLALQLQVHKALRDAQEEVFSRRVVFEHFNCLFYRIQPHTKLWCYSICVPASIRALLLISGVFGRVAISALWYTTSGVSLSANSSEECPGRGLVARFSQDVAAGVASELLFAVLSCLVFLVWELALAVLHRRELFYEETWDAKTREQQVRIWHLKDIAFWVLVLAYICCCVYFVLVFLSNTRWKDGLHWLVSGATSIIWMVAVEPLAWCAAVVAATNLATQTPGLATESCRALGFEAGGEQRGARAQEPPARIEVRPWMVGSTDSLFPPPPPVCPADFNGSRIFSPESSGRCGVSPRPANMRTATDIALPGFYSPTKLPGPPLPDLPDLCPTSPLSGSFR